MAEVALTSLLLLLALGLGFKHSYDADHLVAVANLITRSSRPRKTVTLTSVWAVGHMATATVITVLLFTLKDFFLRPLLANLDWLVASMLIAIGIVGILWEFSIIQKHIHPHAHGRMVHSHPHLHLNLRWFRGRADHEKMLGIGFIHGVASNDELLILFTAYLGVTTLAGILMGVFIFSVGVVAGMILFGLSLFYPILRWGRDPVRRAVNVTVSALSMAYGVYLLLGMANLNLLPVPLPT